MAVDDTAFFRFDTNLNQVVAEIEQGMARIKRVATTPAGPVQQQNIDIGALSGFFGNVQQAAVDLQNQMRTMIQQVGAKQMTAADFRTKSRELLVNTMAGAQRALAAEFVSLPESTRRSLDFREVMRGVLGDIYQTAGATLQAYRHEGGRALARTQLRPQATLIDQLSNRPLAGARDPISQLAVYDFMERLIADSVSGRISRGQADRIGEALGLGTTQPTSRGPLRSVFNEIAILDSDSGLPIGVRATDTAAELRKQLGDDRAGVRADNEYTRRMEAIAKAQNAAAVATYNHEQRVEALRLAQRAARGEFGDPLPSGAYMPNAGRAYVPGAGGLVPADANQTRKVREEVEKLTAAQEKQRIEQENYQRAVAGRQIGSSSTYVTADGAFMRDLGDGRARQLVGLEETRAAQAYGRQLAQVEKQERSLLAHREREMHRMASQETFLGGALGRLHRGDSSITAGLGTQMMSAAAFSFAYGSLFALQAGIRDTVNEVKDYQDSLTDLEVATVNADRVTGDWVNSLSEMSRLTGANVGASLDTAARGVRAFGDAARQSKQEVQDIGSATNEAATKLALIANKPLQDATGDIISVGTAFGLEPDQLDQITDAVANAKRSLGGDSAQIAQGLSLVAITAQEAGYSLTEAAAVISLVQARTDQSGQAIATRLSRIFQIVSGSTGKRLAGEFGVDPAASIKEQIEAFARVYAEGSPEVQDRISSGLGGTANLRELLPLLKEQSRLQDAYRSALDNAGQGTDEFNRKTGNLVGQLKQVAGTISNIQVDLARAGLFAPLGAALEVLNPALQGLNRLIRAYDSLTERLPALQEILAVTLELLIAAKAVSVVSAANAGFGLLPGRGGRGNFGAAGTAVAVEMAAAAQGVRLSAASRRAAEQSFNATILQAAGQRRAAEGVATGGAAAGGIRGGLSRIGRFVRGGPFLGTAAVLGTLAGIEYLGDASDQRANTARQANSTLASFARVDGTDTANDLRNAAQDLNAVAGKLAKTDGFLANQQDIDADVANANRGREYLAAAARRVAAEETLANRMNTTSVFGDGLIETVAELGKGLEDLAADGANAATMAQRFRRALNTDAPEGGGVNFLRDATAARIASNLYGAIGKAVQTVAPEGLDVLGGASGEDVSQSGRPLPTRVSAADATRVLRREIDPATLDFVVQNQIDAMNIRPGDTLTPEQERRLIDAAAASMNFALTPEQADALREVAIQEALKNAATQQGEDPMTRLIEDLTGAELAPNAMARAGLLNGSGQLSRQDTLSLFRSVTDETGQYTGIKDLFEAELARIPESDDGSELRKTLRAQARFGRRLEKRTEGGLPEEVADFFAATDRQLRVAVDDRLEQLRKVQQSAGGLSKKEIRAIGRNFLARRLQNAQGDVDLMIQVMEDANQQALDLYRQTLVNAMRVAAAAVRAQNTFFGQIAAVAQLAKSFALVQQFDYARSQAVVGVDPDAGMLGGEGAAIYDKPESEKKTAEEKAQEALDKRREAAALQAAKAQAAAARRGGSLAAGRAALTAAAASLRAEERGTTEWYQALASWYDARRQMQDAVLEYRYTLDQLRGDITDPVENARDSLRNAARTLRVHRRSGAGKDVLAQDRLAEREARAALEQEKFQQKLSDMQTNEELGRITFQQYIRYLDNEHDRLTAIKNRTRQQQDQLNEIDSALQQAREGMEGMWNFGDINTRGMAYQMRRYIESQKAEQRATIAAQRAVSMQGYAQTLQSVNNIHIDGADIAMIRRVLNELLGGRVRTTQSRRR